MSKMNIVRYPPQALVEDIHRHLAFNRLSSDNSPHSSGAYRMRSSKSKQDTGVHLTLLTVRYPHILSAVILRSACGIGYRRTDPKAAHRYEANPPKGTARQVQQKMLSYVRNRSSRKIERHRSEVQGRFLCQDGQAGGFSILVDHEFIPRNWRRASRLSRREGSNRPPRDHFFVLFWLLPV